jgi:hypothetical protein
MDNPATLLVAIMFVTILAIAIGNILMTCVEIAGGLRQPVPERIHLSWISRTPSLESDQRLNARVKCADRLHCRLQWELTI